MRRGQGKRQARLLRLWQSLALTMIVVAMLILFLISRPARSTPTQLVVEPGQGVAPLVHFIEGARGSLDGEIYLLTSPELLQALESAPARGVRVRLLLEHYPFGGGRPSPEETFARLQRYGVEVRWAPRRFRFTHAKTLLRDRQLAWVGTMNWSAVAFRSNRGFALIDPERAVLRQLSRVFDADWQDRPLDARVSRLVLSPTNSRQQIAALIRGARRSLDVYAEVLGDTSTANLLLDAVRRGVVVRVVWSGRGDAGDLQSGGVQLVICEQPYAHAKAIVADQRTIYVGSVNFTASSFEQNREVGLIVRDGALAEGVERAFGDDFASGVAVPSGRREGGTPRDAHRGGYCWVHAILKPTAPRHMGASRSSAHCAWSRRA